MGQLWLQASGASGCLKRTSGTHRALKTAQKGLEFVEIPEKVSVFAVNWSQELQ